MPTVVINQPFTTPSTGGATAYGFEDIDVFGGGPHADLRPLTVASGVARSSSTLYHTIVRHQTDMASADHFAEADVVIGPSLTNVYTGVSVRMSGVAGVWSWYKLETWGSGTSVRVICYANGVVRGEWYASQTIATDTTYTFKLQAVGSNIKGWVDGVLKFDITDTWIPSNTRVGFHIEPAASTANAGVSAFRAENFIGAPPPVTTPTGSFSVQSGNIVDPNGRAFYPWGGGTVSRPTGIDPNDGFWGTDSNRYSYGNGHADDAVADGWNCTEIMVPLPGAFVGPDPFDLADTLAGLGEMLDEWTAAGIVCIVYPWYPQGYNPTSYAAAPADVRAVQTYLCENYADNPYVWLETMGEAFTFTYDAADPNWTNWSNTETGCYNDAISRGWTGMQVFVISQYGQNIGRMALTTMYDTWYAARASNKVVFGWHNFGSLPTVGEMRDAVLTVKGRGLPIICTSFGQNWADGASGFGGDNPGGDAVGVEFIKAYGQAVDIRVGGIAWQATGPHTVVNTTPSGSPTGNAYSLRYCYSSGRFRPWYDTGEALNEVGILIRDRAALGYATIGGGPADGGGGGGGGTPPPPPPVTPPVVVNTTNRARQTRGRISQAGAGATVSGGRPRP